MYAHMDTVETGEEKLIKHVRSQAGRWEMMLRSCPSSVNKTLELLSALAHFLPPKHTEQSGQTRTGINRRDCTCVGKAISHLLERTLSPADSFSRAPEYDSQS